jgi:hypothetical protein
MISNLEPLKWKNELMSFNERNHQRPTRLEVIICSKEVESDYWLEDGLLLEGIELDPYGDRDLSVEIMLQAQAQETRNHLTHYVIGVRRIGLETLDGRDEGLEIEDSKGAVTILRFESMETLQP